MFGLLITLKLLLTAQAVAATTRNCRQDNSVLFLPLDERFTTRDIFINLAKQAPLCVISPPIEYLPSRKVPANLTAIDLWIQGNIAKVDTFILSSEMYLYGGLINSRISNDTFSAIESRLNKLIRFRMTYPNLRHVYVSEVVMRIPAYNGDFEEPWYWADYGYAIFNYSFYTDKYNQVKDPEALAIANLAKEQIPSNALDEFLWRRQRNFNISSLMVESMRSKQAFDYCYITMDDSAEYGFNIREASTLKEMVSTYELNALIPIYPGADEVLLTLLSMHSTLKQQYAVRIAIIYRVSDTINYIPGYEGQPMVDTLMQQLAAAGGVALTASDIDSADAILLVNNFDTSYQEEAADQPENPNPNDYLGFDDAISLAISLKKTIGFCDNRYANGGDFGFVSYMNNQLLSKSDFGLQMSAYAGWNTNGNTLGTVISNLIILTLFKDGVDNEAFQLLRITEDLYYQSKTRQELKGYVEQITDSEENSSNLTPDLEFYKKYAFKILEPRYHDIAEMYGLNYQLTSVYYPWNRTFEMGFYSSWN